MSENRETLAYRRYEGYRERVLIATNLLASLKEERDFVKGKQYAVKSSGPQPVINICREAVDSKTAKITETPVHMKFVSARGAELNQDMTDYYAIVQKEMDDREFFDRLVRRALIDGTALEVTSYDKDTYGLKGIYQGHIKREIVPLERWFFEEIWKTDIQDEKYIGYVKKISVKAARDMCESKDRSLLKLIVADEMIDANGEIAEPGSASDTDRVTIYTMFERDKDGEVFYTVSTRLVELISPKYLNVDKVVKDSFALDEEGNDYKDGGEDRNLLFEPVSKSGKRPGFGRYPVAAYAPEPIDGSFLGDSQVTPLIQNQKVINYTYLLTTQIIQNNASPKILVKEGALKGQKITNVPGQVLTDYTPYGYSGWGISQIAGGMGSVSNEIINFSSALVTMTRRTNGFDNLTADQMNSDVSGYAYQQYTRQMNLPLMIPQRRYWQTLREVARTDLLYFRYYVGEANYLLIRTDADIAQRESYLGMSQELVNSGIAPGTQVGATLPEVQPTLTKTIGREAFGNDWEIIVDSEEGIEGGQASMGQRYEKVMQYAVNMPDLAGVFVENHPGLDRETKTNFRLSFEAYENSTIHQLRAQLEQYQSVIQQQNDQLKQASEQVSMMNQRLIAQKKAFSEQNRTNVEAMNVMMDEGEVKSNNAKGVGGTSFDEMP